MAKRKYSMTKRQKKVQPAPYKLNYQIPAGSNTSYIDLARDISRLSRRFVRQGKLFAISNIRVTTASASSAAGTSVYISTMQNTWSTANSWMKSFALWQKQTMDAIEAGDAESVVARYRDFKVYMDTQHRATGNLDPVNLGPFLPGPYPTAVVTAPSPLDAEEWDYSQIVIPNDGAPGVTTEYYLHMHGDDISGSKAMIKGYEDSRRWPQNPDPIAPLAEDSWMLEMFDVGNDSNAVVENARKHNNELPYDQDNYPGGDTNYIFPENKAWCFNRSTTGVNTFNLGGMVAPCGLLRIDQLYSENSETDLIIEIELLPGSDKGYHLVNMQDM
jgi:hypothetical protein